MAATLKQAGLGQIVDFVPNHMGIIDPRNEWWMDVLENGPSSRFAPFFDINWDPLKERLQNKVLLPVLGDQYGRVLERGEFHLRFREGAFYLTYYDWVFPLNPRTYNFILMPLSLRSNISRDALVIRIRLIDWTNCLMRRPIGSVTGEWQLKRSITDVSLM